MGIITVRKKRSLALDLEAVAEAIVVTQKENGEIPWHPDGKTDPWDHVEAAMGLNVAGRRQAARRAFAWLAERQLPDGSWYSAYQNGQVIDRTREANMTSYLAVGVWHDFLITGDLGFLKDMWPTVGRAVDFTLSLQAPGGEVYWAISPEGRVDPMALLTGSSSIYMSLKCALAVAEQLGREKQDWAGGLEKLRQAINNRRHLFNMTKSRYAMDWYYPILCGALTGGEARKRLLKHWDRFVVAGQGVLCVSDEPWVTVAETCELVLALAALGRLGQADSVFSWIQDRKYEDGSFWCGFTCPDMVIWPEDKMTWTNGVVLLAADALFQISPAGLLFHHGSWPLRP